VWWMAVGERPKRRRSGFGKWIMLGESFGLDLFGWNATNPSASELVH
jgi:hypothetical protein